MDASQIYKAGTPWLLGKRRTRENKRRARNKVARVNPRLLLLVAGIR